MKIFVSHVNVHQRMTQEKSILIKWMPVSLFPQPSLSLPSGVMDKVAIVSEREVIHELTMYISTHQG